MRVRINKVKKKKPFSKKVHIGPKRLHNIIDDLCIIERTGNLGTLEIKSSIRSAFRILYEFHESVSTAAKRRP